MQTQPSAAGLRCSGLTDGGHAKNENVKAISMSMLIEQRAACFIGVFG